MKTKIITKTLIVNDQFPGGIRIDKYLARNFQELTRSQLKLRMTFLSVNGRETKLSRKIFSGDSIEISYTELPDLDLKPEPIPLDILYEDENAVVINKPAGMVVHPGAGNYTGTLVNGLLAYSGSLEANFRNTGLRPGIVHRLDKDTSGVIITARNPRAHEELSCQFRNAQVIKTYFAVVKGYLPKQEDIIDVPLKRDPHHRMKFMAALTGGKRAVTRYSLLTSGNGYSFVKLMPKTGRTHQLRVHMKHIGCPILGDPVYGREDKRFPGTGLLLHAYKLIIRLPGEEVQRKFTAPLPARFLNFLNSMGWELP